MTSARTICLASASAVALSMTSATPAAGQTANAEGKSDLLIWLDRIVVGSGRAKVATKTPQAVTVLESEDIDEKVPDSLSELAEKIPGVSAAGGDSSLLGQSFNIRGFGPQEVGSNQEGRVLVTVDGATKYYESYRMGGIFSDPALMKRVEVLRGPASGTLYGTGVLGGVINFTTKDASDFLEEGESVAVRVKGEYTSNQDGYTASAIAAARLNEYAEFLLSGNYRDVQNIISGDGSTQVGTGGEFPSGLAKATFYLDDNKEQVFRLSANRTQTDGLSATAPGGAPVTVPPLIPREVKDSTYIISYEDTASDNPFLDLKLTASYSKQENKQEQFLNADFSYAYWEAKAENTVEWKGNGFENYLTMGTQAKYHERRRFDLDGTGASTHPEGNQTVLGAYLQDELILNDVWTIISGARMDWQNLEPVGTTLRVGATPTQPLRSPAPQDASDLAFAPKIATHYQIMPSLAIFGSYAYTERMPGVDEELSFTSTVVQGNLKKEKAHTFEAGFAQDLPDLLFEGDKLAYKVTAFDNYIDDRIIRGTDSIPSSTAPYVNTGETRIYGLEIEANYDSEYVFASVAASLIRGENTLKGTPDTAIAPDEVALTIGGKIPGYDLRFGVDSRFVAEQTRLPADVLAACGLRCEAFTKHDLFVTWRPEEGTFADWELTARVNNILDEHYQEYLQTAGPAKGRDIKLSLARTFSW